MGTRIIKQPNGLYCLYSTISDAFMVLDCDRKDLIDELLAVERRQVVQWVDRDINTLEHGDGRTNAQFTITFEEACERMRQAHGEKVLKSALDVMDKPDTESEVPE